MFWLMKKNFLIRQKKSDKRTNDIIWKISAGQGDDYTAGCLLDYVYFKNHYKMIPLDLSK